eukprot:NODE_23261_length_674_cov_2.082267.p1 GENE.NODE_23261_length_674_cov_2.082267~~NODE_23261_length_674_cov_2.082267.p1  ORF type:complete len:200 (-),score=42.52 NODE_23261_length_674_cov_2.082267:74-634(-)
MVTSSLLGTAGTSSDALVSFLVIMAFGFVFVWRCSNRKMKMKKDSRGPRVSRDSAPAVDAVAMSAGSGSGTSSAEVAPNAFHTGVLTRFSERNGWGLISAGDYGTSDRSNQRRNVRLYRVDKEALSLDVGATVVFRVVQDPSVPDWLRAIDVSRPMEEKLPAHLARLPSASAIGAQGWEQRPRGRV